MIAATNRDLEKDVAEGKFRRDLYFRLHVLEIIVPALRKRPEDIPVLAEYFLRRFVAETGNKVKGFSPRAMEELLRYRWPGNVREMKNVIERAVVLTRGEYIDADDLVLSTLKTSGDTETGINDARGLAAPQPTSLADIERDHILATLTPHRLEQEPHRHHPRHRTLHPRPQNPPLRTRWRPRRRRRIAALRSPPLPSRPSSACGRAPRLFRFIRPYRNLRQILLRLAHFRNASLGPATHISSGPFASPAHPSRRHHQFTPHSSRSTSHVRCCRRRPDRRHARQ